MIQAGKKKWKTPSILILVNQPGGEAVLDICKTGNCTSGPCATHFIGQMKCYKSAVTSGTSRINCNNFPWYPQPCIHPIGSSSMCVCGPCYSVRLGGS